MDVVNVTLMSVPLTAPAILKPEPAIKSRSLVPDKSVAAKLPDTPLFTFTCGTI